MSQLKKTINQISYEATLKALQARTNGKLNSAASTTVLSLMALGLTGCGGGGSGTTVPQFSQGGTAVKGPLSNATVFIDLDGDGKLDSDEISTTTNSDGTYSFSTTDQTKLAGDIIVTTNDNTVDASSGEVLAGVTLKATAGSAIVSPATTLIKAIVDANTSTTQTAEQKLAAAQTTVKTALGITDAAVDLTTFNPFNTTDIATAKEVEAAAQKVVAIVNAIAEAADASGGDKDAAFATAINTIATEVSTSSSAVDFSSTATNSIIDKVVTAVTTTTSINNTAAIADAISNVNTNIDSAVAAATSLEDAREVFAIAQSTLTDAAVGSATNDNTLSTLLKNTADVSTLATAPTVSGTVKKTVLESDVAISSTGSLSLTDNDTTDTVTYQFKTETALTSLNTSSLGGTLAIDSDGNWTYSLDLTADATKNALLQALQSTTYEGDLNSSTNSTTAADFSVVERFKVTVQQVDANGNVTTATYDGATPVTKIITVVIGGVNDAVEATTATISDVANAAQHTPITSIDTSNYFTDAEADAGDGDVITYTDSETLPEGLSLDPATGVISGTPSANALGEFTVVITATDIAGTSATQTFKITVQNVNDVPTVVSATADQTTNEDALFTLDTSTAFGDKDIQFNGNAANILEDEVLTYSATLENDSALPSWLTFNTTTGVLSGTPANDDVGEISVKVTATDIASTSVSDIFKITVANTNDAPTASDKTGVTLGDLNELVIDKNYLASQIDDVDLTVGATPTVESLKVISVVAPDGTGTVTETSDGVWTYDPIDVSTDTSVVLKYIVADASGAEATANIDVNVVDAIPLGTIAEDKTIDVDAMITNAAAELGVDKAILSLALAASPETDLSGTYDPGTDFNGIVSFVIKQSGVDNLPAVLTVTQVNDTATGTVTISGTVEEDSVLTATNDIADVDGLGTLQYQWKANNVAIDGANDTTLTLGQEQVGKTISVDVSFTDGDGNSESKTASTSTTVANVNDLPTGSVTISDTTPTEDQTLTVSNDLADEDGLGTINYQWYADGSAISGETGSSIALTDETLVGKAITVTASYTDGEGATETKTSDATSVVANVNDAPVAANVPTIVLGDSLTLTLNKAFFAQYISDDDAGSDYSITGITVSGDVNGNSTISGSKDNFVYTPTDVSQDTNVTLTYTVSDGTDTDTAEVAVRVVDAIPLGTTNEDTTKALSEMLSSAATALNVDASTLSLALASAPNTILSADYSPASNFNGNVEFVIKQTGVADLPALLTVNQVNDDATGDVTISGTATEDQVLTAVTSTIADVDGLGTFNYVWKANGSAISGATESTLTLGQAQVGTTITVDVSFTDDDGNAESFTSGPTLAVANVNDEPAGSVTISDTSPTENQTLTVSNDLSDEDGIGTIAYQWLADGVDILDATSGSLSLTDESLVGKQISVEASYTDAQGQLETKTSALTSAVENVNDLPTGSVTISGTVKVYQTLTAANTMADEDGIGTINYQWFADGVAIDGETSSDYLIMADDVDKSISVVASYTDGNGAVESMTSAGTNPVQGVPIYGKTRDLTVSEASTESGYTILGDSTDTIIALDLYLDASQLTSGTEIWQLSGRLVFDNPETVLEAVVGDTSTSGTDLLAAKYYISQGPIKDFSGDVSDSAFGTVGAYSISGFGQPALADTDTATDIPEAYKAITVYFNPVDTATDVTVGAVDFSVASSTDLSTQVDTIPDILIDLV